jgi:hypothetical protein
VIERRPCGLAGGEAVVECPERIWRVAEFERKAGKRIHLCRAERIAAPEQTGERHIEVLECLLLDGFVGVVCDGRAKKVWAGLVLLKARQWGKRFLRRRVRRIELARVAITGGTKSLFGRRQCHVGRNEFEPVGLRRALRGGDTFMTV